ncbi:MAG TPA: 2-hydroxyacid dehydrogenase [Candidatus Nanoarchaeia archaeon]|nr:2-hydroxyacid dehydrogenase [Candidatus Nanoarchaeia archaeon]
MALKKILFVNIDESYLDKKYWDKIRSMAESTVSLQKDSPRIMEELKNTDCLLVGFATPVTQAHIDAAPKLRYIGTYSVAYHKIDIEYARKKGVPVTNLAGYCTESVAEFIIAVVLNEIKHLNEGKERSLNKRYDCAGMSTFEIKGKIFGVFGLGNIGTRTAELAQGFGADVRYWNRTRKKDCEARGIRYEDKGTLLKNADFISINFAHTPETDKFLDEDAFSKIKSSAIVVNTVPMETVDLDALERRLKKKDMVFILDHSDEMKKEDLNRLHQYKNCITYPPIAYISKEARVNKQNLLIENIENFLKGKPTNVVN